MAMSKAEAFPVDSFREAASHLRRPFTPAAVKFKPQSVTKTGKTLCVAYIDARLVIERLNLICPHLWHDAYEPTPKGAMWCHLTVDGITRSDVGEGQGKGLVSDALKRAGVHFGIGVSLYAVPQQYLDGEIKYLSDQHQRQLRTNYERWLKGQGIQAFGEPLDHGDAEDAVGDPEADQDLAGGTTGGRDTPASANAGRASSSSARPAKHQSDVTPTPTPSTDEWTDATVQRLKDSGIWDDSVLLKDGLKEIGVVPTPGAQRKTTLFRLNAERREQFRAWIDRMAEQALVDAAKETLGATEAGK
jgi:hypothetical protein